MRLIKDTLNNKLTKDNILEQLSEYKIIESDIDLAADERFSLNRLIADSFFPSLYNIQAWDSKSWENIAKFYLGILRCDSQIKLSALKAACCLAIATTGKNATAQTKIRYLQFIIYGICTARNDSNYRDAFKPTAALAALCHLKIRELKASIQQQNAAEEKNQQQLESGIKHIISFDKSLPKATSDTIFKALYIVNKPDVLLSEKLDHYYHMHQHILALESRIKLPKLMSQLKKDLQAALLCILNCNADEIDILMTDRAKKRGAQPYYIPKKRVELIDSLPYACEATAKSVYLWRHCSEIVLAHRYGKVKSVTPLGQYDDIAFNTKMFSPKKRSCFRIIIDKGILKKEVYHQGLIPTYQPVDTSSMVAHGYLDFAACTVNIHGEISLFSHFSVKNSEAHSSYLNGGVAVYSGEMRIHQGRLLLLNVRSGHYKPNIINVVIILNYFQKQKLDLSSTVVLFYHPIPDIKITSAEDYRYNGADLRQGPKFAYKANDILKQFSTAESKTSTDCQPARAL